MLAAAKTIADEENMTSAALDPGNHGVHRPSQFDWEWIKLSCWEEWLELGFDDNDIEAMDRILEREEKAAENPEEVKAMHATAKAFTAKWEVKRKQDDKRHRAACERRRRKELAKDDAKIKAKETIAPKAGIKEVDKWRRRRKPHGRTLNMSKAYIARTTSMGVRCPRISGRYRARPFLFQTERGRQILQDAIDSDASSDYRKDKTITKKKKAINNIGTRFALTGKDGAKSMNDRVEDIDARVAQGSENDQEEVAAKRKEIFWKAFDAEGLPLFLKDLPDWLDTIDEDQAPLSKVFTHLKDKRARKTMPPGTLKVTSIKLANTWQAVKASQQLRY